MPLSGKEDADAPEEFLIWSNDKRGRTLRQSGARLKDGPQVVKTVEYGTYGNPERPKRRLQFHRYDKSAGDEENSGPENRKSAWSCEDGEIDRLLAFLNAQVDRTGRYEVVRYDVSPTQSEDTSLDPDLRAAVGALRGRADLSDVIALLLSNSEAGLSAAQAAVIERRRALLSQLRQIVRSPTVTETDVQRLIGNAHWIFGGRYVGVAQRRALTMLDQHDIPLLGADGTLHVVELKAPVVGALITRHRNHWIVGKAVHEATAQAMNYLRALDEQGIVASKVFENELGQNYDMSRCFATVIIGHVDHRRPKEDVPRIEVARTLRQYSAGLNRIEVITYDHLIDSAERSLKFESDVSSVYRDHQ